MSRAARASSATDGSARYESAANESAKEAWPGSTLAAAKHLKLLSLAPGIIWPGCRREQRWRRHHQMGVSEPNMIALNPAAAAEDSGTGRQPVL